MTLRPLFAAAALAALALPAAAQPGTPPPPPRIERNVPPPFPPRDERGTLDRRVDYLDGALDLTDPQEAQVRRILEAVQTQMRARAEQARAARPAARATDRRTARPTREQMTARAQEMRARADRFRAQEDSVHAEIRAVLTTEQATRFDALRTDERARVQARRNRGDGRTDRRNHDDMPRPRGQRSGDAPRGNAPGAPRN